MNLEIDNHLFIVGGASSGLGKAIAERLVNEGANIIAIARTEDNLKQLQLKFPGKVEIVSCDITQIESIDQIMAAVGDRQIHGMLVNAGGPPAKTVMETKLEDWDDAYKTLLRWKVALSQKVIPSMIDNNYGRVLYIESAAVKQPMENLVLSNSIRLAVVGFVKTFSQEIAQFGITLNVLAPGSHATPAMNRLFQKKADQTGLSIEDARKQYIQKTSVGFLGSADDFSSLAIWFLSPQCRYVTGQTISVDGGIVKGVFG